jgi:hypothetical protein
VEPSAFQAGGRDGRDGEVCAADDIARWHEGSVALLTNSSLPFAFTPVVPQDATNRFSPAVPVAEADPDLGISALHSLTKLRTSPIAASLAFRLRVTNAVDHGFSPPQPFSAIPANNVTNN